MSDSTSAANREKQRITPEAFHVAPELLGLSLASPRRRAMAILIDLIVIALLPTAGAGALALALGLSTYLALKQRLAPRGDRSHVVAGSQRVVASVLVVLISFKLLSVAGAWLTDAEDDLDDPATVARAATMARGDAATIATLSRHVLSLCNDDNCRRDALRNLLDNMDDAPMTTQEKRDIALGMVQDSRADENEQGLLKADIEKHMAIWQAQDALHAAEDATLPAKIAAGKQMQQEQDKHWLERDGGFSLVSSFKHLASDLGLTFGWGALYMTVLPGLWQGRTIGKRLMSIRVVNLNGSRISYWGSFVRYGGYYAGLATGLLGFLQIYWDENRQAIQDRIGFTAVVNDTPDANDQLRLAFASRLQSGTKQAETNTPANQQGDGKA